MPVTPATSLDELLNIQANVEASFAAYFTANGMTAYHTRSTSDLPDERVIFMAEIGAALGHCATSAMTHTGSQEQDWFSFMLKILVQSDRTKRIGQTSTGLDIYHDAQVAKARKLMLRGALQGSIGGITPLELNWYLIPVLSFAGDSYSVDETALDTTELVFTGQIQIHADAWPLTGD